jgi:hypothetical protein
MNKRILLSCYEVPGFGGANTSSYKLFEMLQNDGLDVYYLNIIDAQDLDYFRYVFGADFGNPKCLKNVYNCILNRTRSEPHSELTKLLTELAPDLLLGVGSIAALLLKRAKPQKRLIFVASGCMQVEHYINKKKVRNAMEFAELMQHQNGNDLILDHKEREAVRVSDLIVTHSEMIKSFYEYIFASNIGKIHSEVIWRAEWIKNSARDFSHLSKPFSERDIDVLFVSSSWGRPMKNYDFVKNAVSRLKNLNVHIIGDTDSKINNATHHGVITEREHLFAQMGNSKSVTCVSVFDAAPGILFEGATLGCNIIASKNCGNWQLCNENLLIDPFDLSTLVEKISLASTRKFEDNMEFFLRKNCYSNLVNIIMAF